MRAFRFYYRHHGPHVSVRVFAGADNAFCGTVTMRAAEWERLALLLSSHTGSGEVEIVAEEAVVETASFGLSAAGLAVLSQLYGSNQQWSEALQQVRGVVSRIKPSQVIRLMERHFADRSIAALGDAELVRLATLIERAAEPHLFLKDENGHCQMCTLLDRADVHVTLTMGEKPGT